MKYMVYQTIGYFMVLAGIMLMWWSFHFQRMNQQHDWDLGDAKTVTYTYILNEKGDRMKRIYTRDEFHDRLK